jgi:methionyl-tRNA formyltransferase
VSIQELGERFDTGRLLCQTPVTTDTDADFTSTKAVLADAAAGLLVQTLGDLPRLSAEAQPQSGPSSVAPKLQRKHSLVDWSASVTDVLARQRAFSYLFPLHTVFRGKSVQLHEFTAWPAHLKMPKVMREETTPVGEALITEHGIVVKCGAGHEEETQALLITSLQTEGRKQQSAFGWAVGFALPTDSASRTLGYKPARFGEAVTAKS